ncbi:ankyrin repeat-containing domain protein [Phyllosticta citrichinensis]
MVSAHRRSSKSRAEGFLKGCDQGGATALGLAAIEGHYDIVKLLLDFGAPINNSDQEGRPPLMWASLWGHYSTMQLLVHRSAKQGLRDIDGFTAIDLASPSERNENERHNDPDYKGWTEEASTTRKIIVNCLLADAKVLQQAPPTSIKETKNWSFERTSSLEFKLPNF